MAGEIAKRDGKALYDRCASVRRIAARQRLETHL